MLTSGLRIEIRDDTKKRRRRALASILHSVIPAKAGIPYRYSHSQLTRRQQKHRPIPRARRQPGQLKLRKSFLGMRIFIPDLDH